MSWKLAHEKRNSDDFVITIVVDRDGRETQNKNKQEHQDAKEKETV